MPLFAGTSGWQYKDSHIRRLLDPAEPVARLLAAAGGLENRLGPVLLQLPPSPMSTCTSTTIPQARPCTTRWRSRASPSARVAP